jgi:dihydrodipicolinate synthase/N-acetylneuraminate lyase
MNQTSPGPSPSAPSGTRPSTTPLSGRAQWLARLLPDGMPPLWCPLITHYTSDGAIDQARLNAHLTHLAPHVQGFLIPGSTGDGWEMEEREIRELLNYFLTAAAKLKLHVLIGVLKTEDAAVRQSMASTVTWLQERAHLDDVASAMRQARVCGFTVCPPRGEKLSQEEIQGALTRVLEMGLPTALYQLPQITQNEISPPVLAGLAHQFPNFIWFKDTSGADRVALSDQNLDGVFLLRGAEGDYIRWLKGAGGPYNGLLLSTANCFARELHQIIRDVAANKLASARETSDRVNRVVQEVFGHVAGVKAGNAFANANKAMDHYFAHGPGAASVPPPRLHAGSCLPIEVIRATGESLTRHGFLPAQGYLE